MHSVRVPPEDWVPSRAGDSFSWEHHREVTGLDLLCATPQSTFLEQTVCEALFPTISPAHVLIELEGELVEAVVEFVVETRLCVKTLNGEVFDNYIDSKHIVVDRQKILAFERSRTDKKPAPLVNDYIIPYADLFHFRVVDLIQPGLHFEIHTTGNLLVVNTVKIERNYGGLVQYSLVQHPNTKYWCHITDPMCHPVGWAKRYKTDFPEAKTVNTNDIQLSAVSRLVFSHRPLKKHGFTEGQLVEVRDPSNPEQFFPGHIYKVLNQFMFMVYTSQFHSEDLMCNKRIPSNPFMCHTRSLDVFNYGYSAEMGFISMKANFCYKDPAPNVNSTDLRPYMNKCGITLPYEKAKTSLADFPDYDFYSHPFLFKPMQYVEIPDDIASRTFACGMVVRWKNGILWIKVTDAQTHPRRVRVVNVLDPIGVFPAGFALEHGCNFFPDGVFTTLRPLPPGKSDRFNLGKHYDPEGGTGKPFLTRFYLEGDRILPRVYINKKCNAGPYLSKERLEKYQFSSFEPGTIQGITEELFRMLVESEHQAGARSVIADIIDPKVEHNRDIYAGQKTMKLSYAWRGQAHYRMKVPVCETAAQFPAFLRGLMFILRCCTHFISFQEVRACKCKNLRKQKKKAVNILHTNFLPLKKSRPMAPKDVEDSDDATPPPLLRSQAPDSTNGNNGTYSG